jgi:hypothetical protein
MGNPAPVAVEVHAELTTARMTAAAPAVCHRLTAFAASESR